MDELWRCNPELIFHVYVSGAKQFQKPYDTYKNWSCFIAEDGEFEYRMGNTSGRVRTGDMVLCPPDTAFHRTTSGLSFHFIGFRWEHDRVPPGYLLPDNGRLCIMNNRRLGSTLSLLRETTPLKTEAGLQYKKHLFRDIWQLYAVESSALMQASLISEDPFVQRAVRLLQDHVESGAPLKQVARELGISPVQLTRLFKKEFRMTPVKYIAGLRMARAARLLIHTGLTLADIAERCGYTDEHHLSKTFKSVMGVNPSAYRKDHTV
ncbi:Helix-turn-helix domain-containing protein [Paenibacillus sp. UNCCL117]|uniref:helix-turn-helix domain-containing protein n=1 Tax=unclassified Paenibacillus TaxID=185978 RepID=UPI0008855621|nr:MULTISPECIES: AraC family transcriptional regulator [unclassified Paenibacillus]SDC96437.1 Helix-turn-helix domain-containing protein [Paenibacillus sp. cl123]SFW30298.1 Helix-turn-helix domain-containing protein [Paenibacillus sp. UNCCL117]